nr:hypothetical protein CFP56_69301 [Quercus suber]
MVQETKYSLLSDSVSLVQQRLDDHAFTMEIISRRLEQLDSNFRGMQAMLEERLPTVQQPVNQGERTAHHQENQCLEAEVLQQPMRHPRLEWKRTSMGERQFLQEPGELLSPQLDSSALPFYSSLDLIQG